MKAQPEVYVFSCQAQVAKAHYLHLNEKKIWCFKCKMALAILIDQNANFPQSVAETELAGKTCSILSSLLNV